MAGFKKNVFEEFITIIMGKYFSENFMAETETNKIPAPGPDVENVGLLNPGDHEMCAFADNRLADAGYAVEDDGAVAAVDVVEGGVCHGTGHGETEAELSYPRKNLCHG
jgi:hypothetical protein